jgi:hypothetical protein
MLFNRPGDWVETQVRLLVAEGFDLSDLREVVQVRDRMLGATFDGPTERLPWGRTGSDEGDAEFVRLLTVRGGFGSPLGDLLALAVRMTNNLRLRKVSPVLREAIDEWFESLCRWDCEDWTDGDPALRVVIDYLRLQLGISHN